MIRFSLVLFFLGSSILLADGPTDNQSDSVRSIPPPGIAIPDDKREELKNGLLQLADKIAALRNKQSPVVAERLPDVEIFEKALRIALEENGFFDLKEIDAAHSVLAEGLRRAESLTLGESSWLSLDDRTHDFKTVRGFRSKIDGSVQPYGVVYKSKNSGQPKLVEEKLRCDVWCRGRSEKGLELQFLSQKLAGADQQPVPGVIMIYPFGRYCNANKLAGEIDTLEALEHARKEYPIDPAGVSIRGFSMGGAAAWHLAVHYPDKWFAANPGAGFSETPQFLDVFQNEKLEPKDYERTLWKLYDCPDWVNNLKVVPTIAYSGELDKQKQAADVMAKASWEQKEIQRFELAHLIGPNTAHSIERKTGEEIERRLAMLYANRDGSPIKHLDFTTYSLRYNRCHWLTINRLAEHWKRASVTAYFQKTEHGWQLTIATSGVDDFSLDLDSDSFPDSPGFLRVTIVEANGSGKLPALSFVIHPRSDRSWGFRVAKQSKKKDAENEASTWSRVSPLDQADKSKLVKQSGLQGPIDDAFMSSFVFVKPAPTGQHPAIDAWVQSEFDRAVREWHRQMRGDVRIISAEDLKDEDIEKNNVVLWGDPKSNPLIAKVLNELPIAWDGNKIRLGNNEYPAEHHVPILIYPNPLNPKKYVVLNSCVTYREYDYLNNARQIPKLPDWAIVDVRTPPGPRFPGKVSAAGFFDENWEVKQPATGD